MSKLITAHIFADFEINQRLIWDIKAAKKIFCVVNVFNGSLYYSVVCPGGVYRCAGLSEAVDIYNEV